MFQPNATMEDVYCARDLAGATIIHEEVVYGLRTFTLELKDFVWTLTVAEEDSTPLTALEDY